MPFDRFEDGIGYIHATGYDCLVDGQWMTEYEDNIFEDAAGCSYEVEPEEEPEWTEEDEAQWAETFKPYPGQLKRKAYAAGTGGAGRNFL